MLEIIVTDKEVWNETLEQFQQIKGQTLCLEHSLVSLSKWEAKYKKPFLSTEKTTEEILDYIKFMTITQNVDPNIYRMLSKEELERINNYIADPMTATKFYENNAQNQANSASRKRNNEKITSELVYYWMISFQIPFECQKWHLNRLLTLIRICSIKDRQQNGGKGSKMSKRDILSQNAALNAARRQRLHSAG